MSQTSNSTFYSRLRVIFERALEGAPKRAVHLKVGELHALSEMEVRAVWNQLAERTALAGVLLHVQMIPAQYQCMACFEKYHSQRGEMRCPYCGSFGAKILAGEECSLAAVKEAEA